MLNVSNNDTALIRFCQFYGDCKTQIFLTIYKNRQYFNTSTARRQIYNLGFPKETIKKAIERLKKDGFIIYRESNRSWDINQISFVEKKSSCIDQEINYKKDKKVKAVNYYVATNNPAKLSKYI